MTVNTYLPRSEMMANWTYHLMRMSWKITDLIADPAKALNEFEIQSGWNVIDYGCGPGRYLKTASKQVGPKGKVYAVDIHDVALECARHLIEKNELENVYPVKAINYFVPIPENSADLIYVLDVFHMVSQPKLFLHELHRLVKPGGNLIIEDGHQKRDKARAKVMKSRRWKITKEEKKHMVLSPLYKFDI